ncbi:MAG: peroxide stress protein YaaA [Methanomicrobia archaeon]|nr:peroxide stress protein YaaA [Methanomicrobia archaeon]
MLEEESLADNCRAIHEILESLLEYTYETPNFELPTNGIYFFYEDGEFCTHGNEKRNRIVRIGTYRVDGNFRSRINSHYRGNKNSSVFRKLLGGALIGRKDPNDRRLKQWLEQDAPSFQEIELEVTKELKEHFSFRCIPVEDKEERACLEEQLIATMAKCDKCKPSENWLGNFATDELVRKSGLWNHQHVTSKNVLTGEAIERMRELTSKNSKEKRALFLIPCCSKKKPNGDKSPWLEVRSLRKNNRLDFLDIYRHQMIDFYSNLTRDEAFNYYKNRNTGETRNKKVEKAWKKNLNTPGCGTMKAIDRYSLGKLYEKPLNEDIKDQLRDGTINNVFIVSAMMGIVHPTDLIPDYELIMNDISPNSDKVFDFWKNVFSIGKIRDYFGQFLQYDYVYCFMSEGYRKAVRNLLAGHEVYYIVCQNGQENPRVWGKVLNEVLLNGFSLPDEVRKVAETCDCKMVELNDTKTYGYGNESKKIRLPFNSENVVPIQKPKELRGVKMSKYYKIGEYLRNSQKQIETLSYDEIERILGFSLPASAYKYRAWWSRDRSGGHPHANAWLNAGWEVSPVELGRIITFRRVGKAKSPEENISISQGVQSSTTPEIGIEDIPELIRKLSKLNDEGIITKEEFEKKKKELLDRL